MDLYARKAEDGSCWLVLKRVFGPSSEGWKERFPRWEEVVGMGSTRKQAFADAEARA